MGKGTWIAVIVVLLVLLGIGIYAMFNGNTTTLKSNTGSSNNVANQNTVSNAPAGNLVQISNFAFSSSVLNVKVGDSVTWTNMDSAPHTVTSDSGSELTSAMLNEGEIYSHTFSVAGTYAYHCSVHPGMKATIIVS